MRKYTTELSIDYEHNKGFLEDVIEVPSTKVRNRIVGYVTTLKKIEEREKLS